MFDWDPEKARSNLSKHGIGFKTASEVFDDPLAITSADRLVDGELRWRTIGRVGWATILFVAHTYLDESGEEVTRIISARKAKRNEIRAYERGDGSAFS